MSKCDHGTIESYPGQQFPARCGKCGVWFGDVTSLRTSLAAAMEGREEDLAQILGAAVQIAALRAREQQLVGALEPFAMVAKRWVANEIKQRDAHAPIAHYEAALEVYERVALLRTSGKGGA